jgi:hypothetical protein
LGVLQTAPAIALTRAKVFADYLLRLGQANRIDLHHQAEDVNTLFPKTLLRPAFEDSVVKLTRRISVSVVVAGVKRTAGPAAII